jgi:hypothetical protein
MRHLATAAVAALLLASGCGWRPTTFAPPAEPTAAAKREAAPLSRSRPARKGRHGRHVERATSAPVAAPAAPSKAAGGAK